MTRLVLNDQKIHPQALEKIEKYHASVVQNVISVIAENKIVVIGMDQNPVVKKARAILDDKKLTYTYLKYGSYFSKWKERLAIKLWSGWPTYPQVFIDGVLIGGASDLEAYFLSKQNPSD